MVPDKSASQPEVEVEYVSADVQLDETNPFFKHFQSVFSKFTPAEELTKEVDQEEQPAVDELEQLRKDEEYAIFGNEEGEDEQRPLSKKALRKMQRMDIATLKQLVARPDVVEIHDVTAQDPKLLVYLKSYRNTVPVPRHWSQKRKYLQGKRGIEKPPFRLPDFIRDTGITTLREGLADKDADKTSKQKQRERVQPKMGRIDIDYQILHDAFFKYQTKPPMTIMGDLYYENKEYEIKFQQHFKPGKLSDKLRQALGMPPGAPPPWLINMQRHGLPPSYPKLRMPGLNAPIPEGASYGYHPGGWGRLPVDAFNRPLYNDFFLSEQEKNSELQREKQEDMFRAANVKHWGEIEDVQEDEQEHKQPAPPASVQAEPKERTKTEKEKPAPPKISPPTTVTPPSFNTTAPAIPNLQPPESIDIRKKTTEAPKVLYQIAEEKQTSIGSGIMGSTHTYVIPGSNSSVSINPDHVDNLSQDALRAKMEESRTMTSNDEIREVYEEETKKRKRKEDKKNKEKKKKFKF
jgi:splicing factor 3B subunit 2